MLSRSLRVAVLATAISMMAALFFLAGYSTGRAGGIAVEHYLVRTLEGIGLGRYAVLVQMPASNPQEVPLSPEEEDQFEVFWEAWGWVEREFYDRGALETQSMTHGAIRGLLESLDDPHTVFLDPVHHELSDSELRGSFEGIGVQVDQRAGRLVVVAPLDGSPGEQAGLRPGDVITHVDGEGIEGLSLTEAVLRIRGPRDTPVTLTVRREGVAEPLTIGIVRDEITMTSVRWEMHDDQVAHLRISSFNERTPEEASAALRELMEQEPRGVVLDLRTNPGGYMHVAIEVTSQFLEDGVVAYLERADGSREPHHVAPGGLATTVPMVVLVNGGTASASEIVAGALQAHQRAALLGEHTYGKGTIQSIHGLRDGSSVRITFARWLTPAEQPLEGQGLTPDVALAPPDEDEEDDPQLDVALRYLQEQVLVPAGAG